MRKNYLLPLSLLFSWGMIAQITVQGIPREDLNAGQEKNLKAAKELKSNAAVSSTSVDYTKGIFIVNEDWFGHARGSINFLPKDGDWVYNAYRQENKGQGLGVTTQYGTIYGDNFYLVSKSGGRLIVADAKTLKNKAGFAGVGGGDGRTFLGVDEKTGYIGTSTGIYLFNIENLKVGKLIAGTEGGGTNKGQIGNMVRTSKYVFAVKQSIGVLIIDPEKHEVIKTIAVKSINTIAQSKDGNVWVGAGKELIKVNPVTFETQKISVSSSISGSWGAWNAGGFCSSTQNNALYWTNGGGFMGGGNTVIKYDIDTGTLNTSFYQIPGQTETYKQQFYGAGLRIDPNTDNLVITTTESGFGEHFAKNWVHIVSNEGNLLKTYSLKDYYWFPALPVFPDSASPEISQELASAISISSETNIDLKDKVSDKDNIVPAIVKSLKEIENKNIVTAAIDKQDRLIINPLKVGTAILEIIFNSNGKTAKHQLTVTVTSTLGIDEVERRNSLPLYPNPFADYFFIEAKKANILSVYSVNGVKVLEQNLKEGENRVDVSHLSGGIYLIKANDQTYKVIKK
ncbi:MAG: DUF5074 domain-containing protein [Flavobacteriaceae bacterium]|jgi:hypothetical protein|nr:DUF5074 domain-containing protein [Flavobacteriaceae bacterium]